MRKLTTIDYVLATILLFMVIFIYIAVNNEIREILMKANLEYLTGFATTIYILLLIFLFGYFYGNKL